MFVQVLIILETGVQYWRGVERLAQAPISYKVPSARSIPYLITLLTFLTGLHVGSVRHVTETPPGTEQNNGIHLLALIFEQSNAT